eukprot:1366864-Amorphochlora_amoeboformis.AAC.1
MANFIQRNTPIQDITIPQPMPKVVFIVRIGVVRNGARVGVSVRAKVWVRVSFKVRLSGVKGLGQALGLEHKMARVRVRFSVRASIMYRDRVRKVDVRKS